MAQTSNELIDFDVIPVHQNDKVFYLTRLTAKTLSIITYVAMRGKSDEEGAVQRVLNPRRITSIKEFTLAGGDYPGAVILNWTSDQMPLDIKGASGTFAIGSDLAQVIDGQHRIAGLTAAIEEDPAIGDMELPVAIYEKLSTRECADIFISINTEQRQVPRSLVFDLYGEATEKTIDPAAVRARDIAVGLNERDESAYFNNIKFPGSPIRRGGISLSTAVSSIKPLVEEKGIFEQLGIEGLETQTAIIANFFSVLKTIYGREWQKRENAFQYAAGFSGALTFLQLKLVPYCSQNSDFTIPYMRRLIDLESYGLIYQEEVKGLGGRDAPNKIYDRLLESFSIEPNSTKKILV